MEAIKPAKPRIFIDADVRFAGTAPPNEHSASNWVRGYSANYCPEQPAWDERAGDFSNFLVA